MHLPAVKRQLFTRCRYGRQLPLVIVELFGGVLLAVVGDCHDAPGREALRQLSGTLRLLCGHRYTTSQDSLIDPA